ncbi:hypothetical protein CTI12_AA429570 [Artemisia annua]|uniref:Aldehyde dehydrogenase domain-containing protein n=1 Tax=Artemisia annua TaxID=35608 RepID=A0A2U1M234_ARTAN|nr:hypothetical protein CTI12_AA429570 [Artemisia annua]
MPGPGPHMMYALGTGQALMSISNGRFSPHHCIIYALNAFFGPDIGSFAEWLTSTVGLGHVFGSSVETFVHDPLFYVVILGLPLSLLYARVSRFFVNRGYLDSVTGVGLTVKQCFLLISAGSLSHFFLDHLFEENGHSTMYTWILSTGWWEGRAPVNPDAVVVIGFLCTCLIIGFIQINRVKPEKSIRKQSTNSAKLLIAIASTYSLWCVSQIYLVNPRRPAVGEEADLGVIVFLAVYFFLPHSLCIMSMNPTPQKPHLISFFEDEIWMLKTNSVDVIVLQAQVQELEDELLLAKLFSVKYLVEWDLKEEGKEVTRQWEDDDVNNDFSLQLRGNWKATLTRNRQSEAAVEGVWNYVTKTVLWGVKLRIPLMMIGSGLKYLLTTMKSTYMHLWGYAGLPPDVLNVVSGYGPSAGTARPSHMDVDKIAFTGSTDTSKIVLGLAAKSNLKSLSQ